MSGDWERVLQEHFPGYLLPESARHALTVDEASRFLSRLTGRPHELALVRAVSTLAPRMAELRDFAFRLLPDLVRALPSQTETAQREWEGGFQGQLALAPTLAHWAAGQRTRFVTRGRRRSFALPENILARSVADRLLRVLVDLREAKVVGTTGWAADAADCEGRLRHLLGSTLLRDVPAERLDGRHELAAVAARHHAYAAALAWHRALRAGMDDDDPVKIAETVAAGALAPLDAAKRFEVAVVLRLVMALERTLVGAASGWVMHRHLIKRDRNEVVAFERVDGAAVRVFYDQAVLDPGPADLGAKHYFGSTGRMRPDLTILTERGAERSAVVIEVKLTDDVGYAITGFREALLYRHEYATQLVGALKAILVTSADVVGAPREGDEVIAIPWSAWPPDRVVCALSPGV